MEMSPVLICTKRNPNMEFNLFALVETHTAVIQYIVD